ncbi:phage tail protein [Teredinibacter sp. KSP-S5-2]|uniref:phage tail-collar fiber domain-containing protein n=1 Tax=Teredinibacter sp. KSP-S5-2 TaxID=3034506 RepID=UPI002934F0EA|nr:phage tail protein [Teredinibacter sp. KSP-S5-2]WNO10440.1 phage tail protein [Teredinibacter sp. KSP-S5-2]
MAIALVPTITSAGLAAVFNATNDGLQARLTQVVFGEQGWTPDQNATHLRAEKNRVDIEGGSRVNQTQIHITAIENGNQEYWVREIGFLLSDGTLFAVWSDAQQPLAWKSADVDLLLAFDMVLSALPDDSVVVEGTGGFNLSPATEDEIGLVRLATEAEARAGVINTAVAMTPWGTRQHGDARYAGKQHTHNWGQVTGKPTTFTPAAHTHTWTQISGRPTSMPPTPHYHDDRYTPTNNFLVSWGRTSTRNRRSRVNWDGSNNFSYNYADIGPPVGYTTSHLMGFLASIGFIHFGGEVDGIDRLWCRWRIQNNNIRVIAQNSENNAASQINYMAIWRK